MWYLENFKSKITCVACICGSHSCWVHYSRQFPYLFSYPSIAHAANCLKINTNLVRIRKSESIEKQFLENVFSWYLYCLPNIALFL